jgi:hypothetical protein
LVISLPKSVFDRPSDTWVNEQSWLTQDKKAIVEVTKHLSQVEQIYKTIRGAGISVKNSQLQYTPIDGEQRPVDGYINLHDVGESLCAALGGDVKAISKGANAPTAVWNPNHPWTNKIGLLRKTAETIVDIPEVAIPRFQRVQSVNDVKGFLRSTNQNIVLKGPYGTWGDEVVPIESADEIERKILEKERIVQDKREWPDFSMLDLSSGNLQFRSRSEHLPPVQYGLVEEAIESPFERTGRVHDIINIPSFAHPNGKSSPIDFVPLIVRAANDSRRLVDIPSILLRISGNPNLNANAGAEYTCICSLEEVYDDSVTVPSPYSSNKFMFDFKTEVERVAGRAVPLSELQSVLMKTGAVAFTARNLSAFAIETEF